MRNDLFMLSAAVVIAAFGTGCGRIASADTKDDDGAEATTEKRSAAEAFFAKPAKAAIARKHISYGTRYTIGVPKRWTMGARRGDSFMAMRKDSSAAVFCSVTGLGDDHPKHRVTPSRLKELYRRAPAYGDGVAMKGEAATVEIGKPAYPARVGLVEGDFFELGKATGYWIDIRFGDNEYGKRVKRHLYCVGAASPKAPAAVTDEVKAVLTSIVPAKAHRAHAPREEP